MDESCRVYGSFFESNNCSLLIVTAGLGFGLAFRFWGGALKSKKRARMGHVAYMDEIVSHL